MGGFREFSLTFLYITLALFFSSFGFAAQSNQSDPQNANEALGKKLDRLLNSIDLQEAKLTPNPADGAIDKSSGNSNIGPTTLHTWVTSICVKWLNPLRCSQWIDPLQPIHGSEFSSDEDASALEREVSKDFKEKQNIDSGENYKIWQVKREGASQGSNLDGDGKFDFNGVIQMRVVDDVQNRIKNVGKQAAAKTMMDCYDKDEKGQNVMPNMECLRMMGLDKTKQMRNRALSNWGKTLANQAPAAALLNEDVSDCQAYVAQVQVDMQKQTQFDEKLSYQARLPPGAHGSLNDQRYQACMQAMKASYTTVNPQLSGAGVKPGDKESEDIRLALSRMQVTAIDKGGADVSQMAKPSKLIMTEGQLTSDSTVFENGGLSVKEEKRETNSRTIASFNNVVEFAAQSIKNVKMRTSNYKVTEDEVRAGKIPEGQSLLKTNGLTADMKDQLKDTSFAQNPAMGNLGDKKGLIVEQSASELTITKAGSM